MKRKRGRPKRQPKLTYGLDAVLQQSIFQSYIGRTDKVVIVHDEAYLVRLMNAHGLSVLGIRGAGVNGLDWIGSYVADQDKEKARKELGQLLVPGFAGPLKNELVLVTGTGERVFSWQHFGVQGAGGEQNALLSVGEDITAQKETEAMLVRRNAILKALSLASEYFLFATPDVWEQNVIKVLEALGNARESERVYVCKNRPGENGGRAVSLKYEWKKTGESHIFHGEEAPWHGYGAVGLGRWEDALSKNEVLCEEVKDLPKEEKQWNLAPEALSVVVVPIFLGDDWWGYVGFEDWELERECLPEEIEALKAVATIFAAAIRRKRTEEELEAEKRSVEAKVQERTRELKKATKTVEQAMISVKQEKARLTASIHSISFGFVMTNVTGTVLLFNHAVNDILGQSQTGWSMDLLAERLAGVVNIRETVRHCLERVEEIKVIGLAYGEKFINLYLTPIKMVEDDGRVLGAVVLIDDVTEAKRLQQSRDEFFAVAAHELRTPLSGISGNASIILDYFTKEMVNQELAEMVQDILKSSESLVAIVNEYLDISRLELNKLEIKLENFGVVPELHEVVHELKETAKAKGLHLKINPGVEGISVHADRERLRQAMINLVGNAIKYTDKGKVDVRVDEEAGRVQVKVKDTGKGIAADDQPYLFQKFRQVGSRVYARDVSEGSGMGLYITRLLMEAMGGRVYLESSEPGKGSVFVLEISKG